MSSKGGKGRKGSKGSKGSKAGDAGVMGSLPSTRPARIGARRESPAVKEPTPAKAVAKKPAKPRARAPKPTVAQPPDTAPRRPAPVDAARPRPVRADAPERDDPTPPAQSPGGTPRSGTELVTTVVGAAGELAQVGLTVGGQLLKRTVGRLPRP